MRIPIHQAEFRILGATSALRALAVALLFLVIHLPLFAQTYTGRISGTLTDQSGGVMPGAAIVITDVQRGTVRTLTTDDAGEYVAPDLVPGDYKIVASAKGFKTVERRNILLEVATDLRIDFTLLPGEASETVIVTEEVPLLNTTSSTLGGTLENETINDLPLK